MARYYEETALIEFIKQYTPTIEGETTMKCVVRAIHNAPTSDVVPKGEVEKIFEEIEKIIQYSYYADELGEWHDETLFLGGIAELKKKYTEGEK